MKNRIKIIVLILVSGVTLCGCASRNSGLYRISTGEESGGDEAVTEDSVYSESTESAEQEVTEEIGNAEEENNVVPVYVHVCGAVVSPGVYEMESEDRVFNAVEAAGGFTEDAAQDYVNLAEHVSDGMKITIPTEVELEEMDVSPQPVPAIQYPEGNDPDMSGSSGAGSDSGLININTADETLLTSITGIGKTRAQAIIEYRNEHGQFADIEDIKNVSGIGDSTYNKLKDEITVK